MLKHTIRLKGPRAKGARISGATLRTLLDLLVEGCRKSIRLRVDGRSTVRGTPPRWLEDAAEFELVGLSEGSAVLEIEAPPLWEAAPETFQQGDFFLDIDRDRSCLQVFQDSLGRALAGDEETDLYDQPLLRHFLEFKGVLSRGLESVELAAGNGELSRTIYVDTARLASVDSLVRKTPASQHVRVTGRLDTIRHSDRMFSLVVDSGDKLRGIAEGISPTELAGRWGHQVVIDGKAVFRPSGTLRRLEAERIELAEEKDTVWSKMPQPLLGEIDERSLYRQQGPRSGLNAIVGRWPGDESDEVLRAALRELS